VTGLCDEQGKDPSAKSGQSEDTIFPNFLDFLGLGSRIGAEVCKTFIAGSVPAVASEPRKSRASDTARKKSIESFVLTHGWLAFVALGLRLALAES